MGSGIGDANNKARYLRMQWFYHRDFENEGCQFCAAGDLCDAGKGLYYMALGARSAMREMLIGTDYDIACEIQVPLEGPDDHLYWNVPDRDKPRRFQQEVEAK